MQICSLSFAKHRRKFITRDSCEKIVHAFVSSKLDYCNSLLFNHPKTQLHRLQRMQNIAARIITLTRSSEHITPILKSLHWLPVKQRIHYKILLLTFRCLHNLAPVYLSDLLTPYTPSRALRSSEGNFLIEPNTKLKTFGDRAFASAAPKLWNKLPAYLRACDDINVFKTSVKTILFKVAFG